MKTLVISLRGFHLGYAGCYGNEWISTPALDRLAAGSVVFDQHFADVPDGAAARRGWRTGCYQFPASDGGAPGAAVAPDLLDELRRGGVRTVLVADGSQPFAADFAHGWDRVDVVRSLSGEATFLEQTLEAARVALEQLASAEQWLLWVDLAPLLPPWEVPADFSDPYFHDPADRADDCGEDHAAEDEQEEEVAAEEEETFEEDLSEEEIFEEELFEEEEDGAATSADPAEDEEEEDPLTPWIDPVPGLINTEDDIDFLRLQSSYAAAVSFADAGVDTLLGELERLGWAESCLVVLTGDHGQALGEHAVVGPYRPWLHDELVHLPLLLRLPATLAAGREVGGGRVAALTQSVDLMPTLLEAFALTVPAGAQGHSLLPLARAEAVRVREYACCGLRLGAAGEWCLRTPEWAFLLPDTQEAGEPLRGPQLYVKPDDRWEVNNVLQHHLERADRFEQTLKVFVTAARHSGAFAPPSLDREAVAQPRD